jgi:hypothetical protein
MELCARSILMGNPEVIDSFFELVPTNAALIGHQVVFAYPVTPTSTGR